MFMSEQRRDLSEQPSPATHTQIQLRCCQTTAGKIRLGAGFARPSEHVKQLFELFSQPLFSTSVIIRFYKVSERALQA